MTAIAERDLAVLVQRVAEQELRLAVGGADPVLPLPRRRSTPLSLSIGERGAVVEREPVEREGFLVAI
jgi:hypothetical protein